MNSSSIFLSFASFSLIFLALCRAQNEAVAQGDAQPPPFLTEASQEKINEFYQYVTSLGHLKETEIAEKVKEWVDKQSEEIQKKYAEFEQERERAKAEGEAAHEEVAKKADKEAINPNLSANDKAEMINRKVQSLPKKVRDEIGGAMDRGGGEIRDFLPVIRHKFIPFDYFPREEFPPLQNIFFGNRTRDKLTKKSTDATIKKTEVGKGGGGKSILPAGLGLFVIVIIVVAIPIIFFLVPKLIGQNRTRFHRLQATTEAVSTHSQPVIQNFPDVMEMSEMGEGPRN